MLSGSLEKKLASYALAGGAAVLAGGQAAEAAVVVTVLETPLVASVPTGDGTAGVNLDLDGDGSNDFLFSALSYVSDGEVFGQFDKVDVLGLNGATITGTEVPLSLAQAADQDDIATQFGTSAAALASNPTLSKAKLLARYSDGEFFDTSGEWVDGVPGILGVRFMLGGTTPTMGFIRARVDFGSATVTIDQYGYETAEVPEPGTVSLLALGAAGVAALRRRRQVQ